MFRLLLQLDYMRIEICWIDTLVVALKSWRVLKRNSSLAAAPYIMIHWTDSFSAVV